MFYILYIISNNRLHRVKVMYFATLGAEGFEPSARRLTAVCSASELCSRIWKCETRTPPLRPWRSVQTFTPHSHYSIFLSEPGFEPGRFRRSLWNYCVFRSTTRTHDAEREIRTLKRHIVWGYRLFHSAISADTPGEIRTHKITVLSRAHIPVLLRGHMLPKGVEPSVLQDLSLMRLPIAPRQLVSIQFSEI